MGLCNSLQTKAKRYIYEKNWDKALTIYLHLLDDEPEHVCYNAIVGEIYVALEKYPLAVRHFEKAIVGLKSLQQPDQQELEYHGTLCFLLGQTLQMVGENRLALTHLEAATQLRPNWVDPYLAIGRLAFDLGEHQKSLSAFYDIARISPKDGSAWLTVAWLSQTLKNHNGAIDAARKTLQLDPNSEQAHMILADSLRQTGYGHESIAHYEAVIADNGNHVHALYGYGQSLLATGDLDRGWLGFEARRICEAGTWGNHFLPDWNGETDPQLSVLAYGEGGIASEIQFASCLPDLAQRIGQCYVECSKPLRSLFERSFPGMTVMTQGCDSMISDQYPGKYFQKQVAFGSLPRFFRTSFEQFPKTCKPYLVADPQKVANWKKRLAQLPGEQKIGILCEGNWSTEPQEQCRLPFEGIGKMFNSLSPDSVHWVSLQHGSAKKGWLQFCESTTAKVSHFQEAFAADLDELAAMILALDLVIAPTGFQAHLAAALGVPCWVVLQQECDWRWHLSRSSSPWYPNVKLFRQKHGESWPVLTQRIMVALHSHLSYDEPLPVIPFPASNGYAIMVSDYAAAKVG